MDIKVSDPYYNGEFVDEETAATIMLADDALCLGCDDKDNIILCVNVNDIFGWACADAEDVPYDELENLYIAWKADATWGPVHWACKQRNQRPQYAVMRNMQKEGAWTSDMEALPEREDLGEFLNPKIEPKT